MALRENRALVWKPNAASGKLVLYQVDSLFIPHVLSDWQVVGI
jgi:hypothetical protein